MALIPSTSYSGQVSTSFTSTYPYGKAQDETVSGDGTGTPLEADWINDLWGFMQAILVAGGVTPSGTPDNITASDYLNALAKRNVAWTGTHTFSTAVKVGGTYVQFLVPVTGRQDWLKLTEATASGTADSTCITWDADGSLVPSAAHVATTDKYRVHFRLPATGILTKVTGVVFHGGSAYSTSMQVKRRTSFTTGPVSANVGAAVTFSAAGTSAVATAALSEVASNAKEFWVEFVFDHASVALQGILVEWTDNVIQSPVT